LFSNHKKTAQMSGFFILKKLKFLKAFVVSAKCTTWHRVITTLTIAKIVVTTFTVTEVFTVAIITVIVETFVATL
jgi:hypothetical protein